MKSPFKISIFYLLIISILTAYIAPCSNVNAVITTNFYYSSMTPYNGYNIPNNQQTITIDFPINIEKHEWYDSIALIDTKSNSNVQITKDIVNSKTLQINISNILNSNSTYRIYIPAGALKDVTNPNNINAKVETYFTTANNTFDISSSTPYNNQTSVDLSLQHVTFNFYYNISANNQQLFNSIKVVDTLGNIVSEPPTVANNLLQLKLNNLMPYTMYTVNIPSGTLVCTPDNTNVNSINNEINLKFTTYNDTTRPTCLTNSYNDVIDPNTSLPPIKFDKKIKLTSDINKITLKLTNAVAEIPINASISADGYNLIVTPDKALESLKSYTLYVPSSAISDLFLNTLYNNISIRFSTGLDTTPPTIISTSIDSSSITPIGTNEITINFSKPIRYATQYQKIELKDFAGTVININKVIASDKLIITVLTQLTSDSQHTLTIPANAVQDNNGNLFAADFITIFTTNQLNGTKLEISSSPLVDGLEANAGTSFDDIVKYVLPVNVTAIMADRTSQPLDVVWYQSTPDYKERVVGSYTFKGKFVVRDNIFNTRKIIATAKVKIIDSELPVWLEDPQLSTRGITNNSVRIEWTEATDDTSIKEYSVEMKVDGVTKKTTKIAADKVSRLSTDKNDYRYNVLYTTLTGLQPDTRYNLYMNAIDSQNKSTNYPLEESFMTDSTSKPATNISSTPRPTARPTYKPTPTPTKSPSSEVKSEYFDDLQEFGWAVKAIDALAKKGVIKGTSDTSFSPSENITRADLTLLIMRAFDFGAPTNDNFDDVTKDSYYYDKIGMAKSLGIIKGNSSNLFYPEEYISREDMFVILKRAIDNSSVKLDNYDISPSDFNDINSVSDYARNAIESLITAGLIKGDSKKVNPKKNATRAEVAFLLNKI